MSTNTAINYSSDNKQNYQVKIGILTFHWATNYGAILQAFSLQEYLKKQGHDVEVINFKPKQYDYRFIDYLIHPRSMLPRFREDLKQIKKDKQLEVFRRNYLSLTQRCYSLDDVKSIASDYNVLISGSDQILNPSFTLTGEKGPCSVYYLNFATEKQLKIGYSVSFGCTEYPQDALCYAKKWIASFDRIGVRESGGFGVLLQMEFKKMSALTPDPVVLYGDDVIKRLCSDDALNVNYIYSYMLHGTQLSLNGASLGLSIVDETKQRQRTIETWLSSIKNASYVVTNSYHGTIVSLLLHKPLVVVLASGSLFGMNDRFTTLLNKLGLMNRISDNKEETTLRILQNPIDWEEVDSRLRGFQKEGEEFLKF